jgi:4-hydroxy-2-oxoheptanedioate aldolase
MATTFGNKALAKMRAGQAAVGTIIGFGAPIAGEMLARAGFDFVAIDTQHGAFDDDMAAHAFRYIHLGGATPMARVNWNDFGAIGRLLDRGALGIIVPMVNSVDEARAAASAMRYPPRGGRSTGGAHTIHLGADYDKHANDEMFLAVQIETVQAAEHAEEILSVDGVDGCWIGPADLAKSMGVDRSTAKGKEEHFQMCLRICEAARKAGKVPGISGDFDISLWLRNDFRFVTVSYDGGLML